MGMGLFEYAAAHSCEHDPQPETVKPEPMIDAEERRAIMDGVQLRMDQIGEYLAQGRPAEIVLYKAIECIGLMTGAEEWEEQAIAELDKTYEKLNQQALYIDQGEAARAAALERAEAFQAKAKRQLAAIAKEGEAVALAARKAIATIQTRELMENSEKEKAE